MNPPSKTTRASEPAPLRLTWNDAYHILCERVWLISCTIALFLTAAAVYLLFATPIYEADSTIEVGQREKQVVTVNADTGEDYKSLEVLKTIEGNLKRPSILLRVLARPEFQKNPELKDLAANPTAPENKNAFKKLVKSIDTKLRRNTRLIDISVENRDPETARQLCNALGEEYIRETFLARSGTYQSTSEYLVQEAKRLKEKLQNNEMQLQDYAKVVDLRTRIREEQKNLDTLRERYLEKHPKVIQSRTLLANLKQQFVDEMKKRGLAGNLTQSQGAEIPMSQNEIDHAMATEESQYNVLTREIETDRTVYESVLERLKEANLSQGYEQVNVRVVEHAALPLDPAKPHKLLTLALALFLGTLTGTSISFALSAMNSSFRTVDAAEEFLELSALAAIPEIDRKQSEQLLFETPYGNQHGVEKQLRRLLPVFRDIKSGKIPDKSTLRHVKDNESDHELAPSDQVVILNNPSSLAAEAFRSLRATLKLAGRKHDTKTFLFTSAIPGEGKSFTASNYAVSLAQEGNRVLLIDADLRRPTIHEKFKADPHRPGLTEVLVGEKSLQDAISPTSMPGLDLLTSGGRAPNPAELLSDSEFDRIATQASGLYDKVIIDSAPVNAVSDTLLICGTIHCICLVIRAGTTPRAAVYRAYKMLQKTDARVTGFVLNRLPVRSGFGANPYYYHYNSGEYGKAYGSKK